MIHPIKRAILWISLVVILGGLAACKSPSGPDETSPLSPLPVISPTIESPLVAPTQSALTPFSLDEPLLVGATRVTGTGPADVVIKIIDVTFSADQIGGGKIKADGTFAIDVTPLSEGHRIGILVSEPYPPEVEANLGVLWGKGGIQLPMVGDVFASAMTTKP